MKTIISAAVLCALALSACAPDGGADGQRVPAKPPDFELAMTETGEQAAEPVVIDYTVGQVSDAIASGDVRLIDVRTDEEVAEGMIPGAEHVALDQFDPAIVAGSDTRPIILYCRSGNRSRKAGEKLSAHLGQPVPHLEGGFKAWVAAGKPTTQGGD